MSSVPSQTAEEWNQGKAPRQTELRQTEAKAERKDHRQLGQDAPSGGTCWRYHGTDAPLCSLPGPCAKSAPSRSPATLQLGRWALSGPTQ